MKAVIASSSNSGMLLWLLLLCHYVLVVYPISSSFAITNTVTLAPPNTEIQALQVFYNALKGINWNWKYPEDQHGKVWNFTTAVVNPCDRWQGITCNTTNGHVIRVVLANYNLQGSIPQAITNLTYLQQLIVNKNTITGQFDAFLCQLQDLENIGLYENQIEGSIASCFMTLPKLQYLALQYNQIGGYLPTVPSTVNTVMKLFAITGNNILGTIPDSFRYLHQMQDIYIGYNYLSGYIDVLTTMLNLKVISAPYNLLHGSIADSIGNLKHLQYIYLHENYLTGSIPNIGRNFSHLIYFSCFLNELSGSLPPNMYTWSKLQVIALDTNYLTSTLSEDMQTWTTIQQFTVYNNFLSGSLPVAMSSLQYLQLLLVQSNLFEGRVDQAMNGTTQPNMITIDISSNHFTGQLPDHIFGQKLQSFSAFQTCFDGSIPLGICQATSLQTLSLDGMTSACAVPIWPGIPGSPKYSYHISGGIPACLFTDLHNLTIVHISGNGLTGTIPDLPSYGNLTYLDLSYNSLTGSIPNTLQGWHLLENLNLKNNRLVGKISYTQYLPYSYSELAVTTSLTLSSNRLSGVIPRQIEYDREIDIVEGNLFSCSDNHQPPQYDADSNNFICGSNLLDFSLYLFLVVGCLFAAILLLVLIVLKFYYIYAKELIVMMYELYCFVNDYHKLQVYVNQYANCCMPLTAWDEFVYLVVSIFWWRARVVLFLQSDFEHRSHEVMNLKQFLRSLRTLRRLTLKLMLVIIIITIPMYTTLKEFFATYSVQHHWCVSGVFLSGVTPAGCMILLWAVFLTYTMFVIKQEIPRRVVVPNYLHALQFLSSESDSRSVSAASTTSSLRATAATEFQGAEEEALSNSGKKRSSLMAILATMSSPLSGGGGGSINEKASSNGSMSFEKPSSKRSSMYNIRESVVQQFQVTVNYFSKVSVWISFFALVTNSLVVLSMKAAFIYLLVSADTSFGVKVLIEACLSGVDVTWTAILVPLIIRKLPRKDSSSRMFLKSFMLYFNSVFAPCIVIAIADRSCFNGMFVKSDTVTESFTFDYCLMYDPNHTLDCAVGGSWNSVRSYTPLFYYNYDCYSTIVVEYVPVFLLTYSVLSLLIPIISLVLVTRKYRWKILDHFFPRVYFLPVDIQPSTCATNELESNTNIPFADQKHDMEGNHEVKNALFKDSLAAGSDVEEAPISTTTISISTRGTSEQKRPSKLAGSTSTQQIIYPAFILASAMHHLLVMLTFGIMSPPLCVAIGMVVSSASLTWEVLIGRWLVQDDILSNSSTGKRTYSKCENAAPNVGQYTKALEELCVKVCCSPTKCYGLLAFGSAIFFACVTVDMGGDRVGWRSVAWMAGLCFGYALLLTIYFSREDIQEFSNRHVSTRLFSSATENTSPSTDLNALQHLHQQHTQTNRQSAPSVEPSQNDSVTDLVNEHILANQNRAKIPSIRLNSVDRTSDHKARTDSTIELTAGAKEVFKVEE